MASGSGVDVRMENVDRAVNIESYESCGLATESVHAYKLGGYHPVLLGDTFQNGTYRILKKLGYGAFSTVWLAKDTKNNKYVAMKFLRAEFSENCKEVQFYEHISRAQPSAPGKAHTAHLLDSFSFSGPNGTHCCLVLELMGPNIQDMLDNNSQFELWFEPNEYEDYGHWEYFYPINISKLICAQVLQGLGFLHREGITHGDIQPGNILFTLPDISHLPESKVVPRQPKEMYTEEEDDLPDYERSPGMEAVKLHDGSTDLPPSAPKYLIAPQPLTGFAKCDLGLTVKISDFGAASWSSNNDERTVTPVALRAPESWLCDTWDEKIDIWALGCVFNKSREQLMDECLAQMVEIIGPLPPALSSKWPNFSRCITADGTLRLFDESLGRAPAHIPPLEDLVHQFHPPDATEEDMNLLGQLLRAMLQYNPADRPTAEELLEFEWLKRRVEAVEYTQSEIEDNHQQLNEAQTSAVQLTDAPVVEESGTTPQLTHVETTPAGLETPRPLEEYTHTITPHHETTNPRIESQSRSSLYFKRLLVALTRALRGLFRSRDGDD